MLSKILVWLICFIIAPLSVGALCIFFESDIKILRDKIPRDWIYDKNAVLEQYTGNESDPTARWIYVGLFRERGSWYLPRLFDMQNYIPMELPGRRFRVDSPINIRRAPYEETGRIDGRCDYDESKSEIIGNIREGETVSVLSIHELCNGYIWARINRDSDPRNNNIDLINSKIVYYRKLSDGNRVINALDANSIPYEIAPQTNNRYEYPTNTIACGPDTPVSVIKSIAKIMIDSGIQVYSIARFIEPQKKLGVVELVSTPGEDSLGNIRQLDTRPLSLAQIEKLTSCPDYFAPLQN